LGVVCAAGYYVENTCTGSACWAQEGHVCTGGACEALEGYEAVACAAGYYLENTCTGDRAVCACKACENYEGYETAVFHSGVMGVGGAWEAQEGDRSSRALRDVTWEARARATRVCVLVWVYLCSLAR
jgi:hypothetical protein